MFAGSASELKLHSRSPLDDILREHGSRSRQQVVDEAVILIQAYRDVCSANTRKTVCDEIIELVRGVV